MSLVFALVIVSGSLKKCYSGIMRRNRGFSLIELLVVVGILGILMASGIATYNQLNATKQVELEVNRIAAQLRSWQKEADSGVGAQGCNSGDVYSGVRVSLGSGSMRKSVMCGSSAVLSEDVNYQNGIQLSSDALRIDFRPVGGGVSIVGPHQAVFQKGDISYQITFTSAGGISVRKYESKASQ